MKIAIIGSRGYPSTYGGFETFVRRIVPYLRDKGHEVTVYGRSDSSRIGSVIEFVDGARVVTTAGIDTKAASALSYGLTASLHARAQPYDAAIVVNVANGYFLPILARAGIPTLVNVDGIEWERDKWSSIAKTVFKLGALATKRYATEIVVDSEAIGDYWRANFRRESTFIPYGADVVEAKDHQLVLDIGLRPDSYALAVARLVPENNVELFLDALEIMGGANRAVVVGSAIGWPYIENRIKRLEKEGCLTWLGHVGDQRLLNALWSNAGVYFHGHSVGGTNPALLQAMGCGAPVVALDTPFNREVLGEVAGLFTPLDAAVAARTLSTVLSDSELRSHMALAGIERIRSHYDWEAVCEKYEAALGDISGRGAAPGESVVDHEA